MNRHSIELKKCQTAIFKDLTLTNISGEHKVLMGHSDLPFAEIILKTKRTGEKKVVMSNPQKKKDSFRGLVKLDPDDQEEDSEMVSFDDYTITVEEVEWNGKSIKLSISQVKSLPLSKKI